MRIKDTIATANPAITARAAFRFSCAQRLHEQLSQKH
jgi:hypothetical protein